MLIIDEIMHMHHADSASSFVEAEREVFDAWLSEPSLVEFTRYFSREWLESRCWRWQVYHTLAGYATTNNPCETFNSEFKIYTGRRKYFLKRLLDLSGNVVRDVDILTPTGMYDVLPPHVTSLEWPRQ